MRDRIERQGEQCMGLGRILRLVGMLASMELLVACPQDGDGGSAGSGGSAEGPSVEGLDACSLLDPAFIEQLTGYAVTTTPSSPGPGGCLYDTADGDVGIYVSIGRTPGEQSDQFLGIRWEDGGNGVKLKVNDDYGEIVGLVYPDESELVLSITGSARDTSTGDPASPIRDIFVTKGGAELPIEDVYAALIDALRAEIE